MLNFDPRRTIIRLPMPTKLINPPAVRPVQFSTEMIRAIQAGKKTQTRRAVVPSPDIVECVAGVAHPYSDGKVPACKFGGVGDLLWVRERCSIDADNRVVYAADRVAMKPDSTATRFRPSFMMPRSACRMMLRIESCRVEKLSQISRDDALAEGFPDDQLFEDPILWFHALWDGLCKPEHSWAADPWVWVLGFSVIQAKEFA